MNNRHKKGFTIIEWLISFFITLLVLTLVFQFSAKIYSQLLRSSRYNTMFTDITVALDAMSIHIFQAPDEMSAWKQIAPVQLLWVDQKSKTACGYLYEKNTLFFIKGKRKNILMRNLEDVTFIVQHTKDVVQSVRCAVLFSYNKKIHTIRRLIIIKNGELS